MKWTKEHPEPPFKKPSRWYWFIFDSEDEMVVMEVWPERKCWPDGLWGPEVIPPEHPLEKPKTPKKSKRGRPRKNK